MDHEEPHCSYQPNTKRAKPNDESDTHESDIAIVDAVPPPVVSVNQQQTAAIFKLDIDCFEEAFDYLWLQDLVSLSETCKRLNQVAGYCFQQNYLGSAVCADFLVILSSPLFGTKIGAKNFLPYIQKIKIYSKTFQYVLDARSALQRLEQIHIKGFTKDQMNRLKEFSMGKVEVLRVGGCVMGNTFQEILDQCVKLKRLEIMWCDGSYNWLDRKYPTLEYFKVTLRRSFEGIPKFLELNPNIRKFATSYGLLWQNRNEIMNIKLNDLALEIGYSYRNHIDYVLLNKLHKIGYYKKLQLYFMGIKDQNIINELSTVNGLSKLHIFISDVAFTLSALTNLEELYVPDSKCVADLEILPKNLLNLKRIHFYRASIDDLMPFITRSIEMQRMKVNWLRTGVHFNEDTKVIDLLALNREREKLPGANKITMYVNEYTYLATKWELGETDLSLIRLKRETSYEWHHDFSFGE